MVKTQAKSESDNEIPKTKAIEKTDEDKAARKLAKLEKKKEKAGDGEETYLPPPESVFTAEDGPSKSVWAKFLVPGKGALQTNEQDEDGYVSFVLASKRYITGDSIVFKFANPGLTFGIGIGQHVRFKAAIDGETVTRKYTPISDVLQRGTVDFVIKIYRCNEHPGFPHGGLMTQYLEKLKVGDSVLMS